MKPIIKFSDETKKLLKSGIDKLTNAVKSTLGPKGRPVIIDLQNQPITVSDDGVTVAKHVILEDEIENCGAKFLTESAIKTNDIAGDGTTTAILLTHSIITEGFKYLANNSSPVILKRNLEKISNLIIENLNKQTKKITTKSEILNIATIASGNKEIAEAITKAIEKTGPNGVIAVDESPYENLELEVAEGMQIKAGFVSPYMATNFSRGVAEYENPDILVSDLKITGIDEILPFLQKLHQVGRKNLILFVDEIEGEALSLLVINKLRGIFNTVAIQCPGVGANKKEYLKDIAIVTGAKIITKEAGQNFNDVTIEELGKAKKVIVTKDKTIIINGKGSKTELAKYESALKEQLNKAKQQWEKEKLQERIANLTGKIVIIKVGAATESEVKAKKFKIEDAINATKAAIEEGIVVGGGIALLNAIKSIKIESLSSEERDAYEILKKAIYQPIKQIAENAGESGDLVLKTILNENSPNFGFNAETNQFGDLFKQGIIDPLKVVKTAFKNAISISSLFLLSDVVISIKTEDDKK